MMNAAMKLSMVGGLVGRWWRPAEKQAPFLLVRREDRGGTTILHLAGRLAVEEIGVFSDHLHDVLRDGATRLVVNLTACPFADSAGVAVLVRTREQAREHGVRFLLVGVGPQVHSVLEMARLVSLFDIRASLDDAMAG
jgi:anti-sigma B factor antagonist